MAGSVTRLILFTALAAFAQPQERPSFEVASVRLGQPGRPAMITEPGSLTFRNQRLITCIAWAYDVAEYQISGPNWMNDISVDVVAKASTPAKETELRAMLQTLLADRFKLALHRETKELNALILTVGKGGSKLEPTETVGSPSFQTGKMNLTGKGATVAEMTQFLSRELHIPFVDQTGLTGHYNYFLDIAAYVTEEMQKSPGPPPEANSIVAQAMQAQLGLKLEAKKAPVEMLVIDRVEKTPTEN